MLILFWGIDRWLSISCKSITWKLLQSGLSTDEAANLRALPQAAPRSFEHPGHNWTANPSRNEMDLEEWKLHLTGCFLYSVIMINCNSNDKLWVCVHCFPLPFRVVPTSGFQQTGCWIKTGLQEINLPMRKVWSPYLLCLFACKETWTNMPSCHPPTVLPQAQHAGGSNPSEIAKIKRSHSSTRLRHTGGSEELLVGNMGFRLSPRRSRSREIGVLPVDLPQTRSGLKKMEMRSLK